ncbi:phosphatidylinositol 3,4,5-trisphosphate 3-phosphatase and dual-specificity protein phosphatase PTEN-like isoform X3 [Watersipora subatra]|uniref:phosphatidylinositol 3,4,5-trisphosphate 3-phosphatase and dual-specificity protein phosphatase PTEN-like isoform X3 n=1 Tax=Watersipora subatra TaxID=2589382 RepID=UPI00355AEC9C
MASVLNVVRKTVSKKKRRFEDGNYNLDLTYVKQNLIAMGFPAEKMEGVYRNHIDDVVKFLEEKHHGHYKVYNLCSERKYDVTKFQSRVAHYPFDDHNPPRIELIQPFCEDVDAWLAKHPDNVAVVHCKAGKGRTGVMICAYLLHQHVKENAADALKFYDETRTSDHKGVTIPSQRRYVGYYDLLLKAKPEKYVETTLLLKGIRLKTIPRHSNLTPQIVIWKSSSSSASTAKLYESLPISNASKFDNELFLEFTEKLPVSGDTLITMFNKPLIRKKERMFQFWFNTYFVTEDSGQNTCKNGSTISDLYPKLAEVPKSTHASYDFGRVRSSRTVKASSSFSFDMCKCLVLKLNKQELDKANKDRSHRLFDPNFQVICYFEREGHAGTLLAAAGLEGIDVSLGDVEEVAYDNLSDSDTDSEAYA